MIRDLVLDVARRYRYRVGEVSTPYLLAPHEAMVWVDGVGVRILMPPGVDGGYYIEQIVDQLSRFCGQERPAPVAVAMPKLVVVGPGRPAAPHREAKL